MVRYVSLVGLSAAVVGLWLLYGLSSDYRVFGGVSTANVLLWAAWMATALLLVLTLGRVVVAVAVTLLDRDTTGLQRGIIYAVVAFVVISGILAALGTNATTLLATSAIATAIVGLAMQTTIGGLVAGSTLQLDRALHVGDVLLVNQEPIEVMSMSWRSVVGRKDNGAVAIIPNARIADGQIDVIRADHSVRVEVTLTAGIAEPPHRVGQALIETVHDLPGFDPSHPVHFDPTEYRAGEGSVAYRLGFWVRKPGDLVRTRAILMLRIWYVYQREDIPWLGQPGVPHPPNLVQLPQADAFKGMRLDQIASVRGAGLASVVPAPGLDAALMRRTIAACGPPLAYTDGERIVRPRRLPEYSLFLLAEGEVEEVPAMLGQDDAYQVRQTPLSGRTIAIGRIAEHLARAIGPYAEIAVREAAAVDARPAAVKTAVAAEIEDAAVREAFLRSVLVDDEACYQAGLVFGLQGGYSRMSSPPLRALRRAVIVPLRLEGAEDAEPPPTRT